MSTTLEPATPTREARIAEAREHIHEIMAYRRRAICAQPIHREVSLPQLHVLMLLQERGRMMVSELAGELSISMPSASSIIDRIEENCLVERIRDAADRRVVYVEITDRGRTLIDEIMGVKRETVGRLLAAMCDEELEDLCRGIGALLRGLRRLSGESEDRLGSEAGPSPTQALPAGG